MNYIEIDQQADVLVAELEVGQQLSLMDGRYCVNRLDLNDNKTLHQNIQAKAKIKPHAVVDDWKRQLHTGPKSSLVQFMHQTCQIYAFQKPPRAL